MNQSPAGFVYSSTMTITRLFGFGSIGAAAALFAAMAYEPANLVTAFGAQGVLSEATVVLLALAASAALGLAGAAANRRPAPQPAR